MAIKFEILCKGLYFQISWLLILFAKNVYFLYASRALNGIVGGGVLAIIPLYLSEISTDRYATNIQITFNRSGLNCSIVSFQSERSFRINFNFNCEHWSGISFRIWNLL